MRMLIGLEVSRLLEVKVVAFLQPSFFYKKLFNVFPSRSAWELYDTVSHSKRPNLLVHHPVQLGQHTFYFPTVNFIVGKVYVVQQLAG